VRTGVESFIERMKTRGRDIRALGNASIAAIGPATAARLEDYALRVAAVPGEYRAEEIVSAIGSRRIRGKRFLIPRAEVAREAMPEILRERGREGSCLSRPAYRTIKPKGVQVARGARVDRGWEDRSVTFTSSSTVTNFCEMIGGSGEGIRAAAIGPITAATAEERGFRGGGEGRASTRLMLSQKRFVSILLGEEKRHDKGEERAGILRFALNDTRTG